MALRGGEDCLRSREPRRLHGLSDIPPPRTTRARPLSPRAHFDAQLQMQTVLFARRDTVHRKPAALSSESNRRFPGGYGFD